MASKPFTVFLTVVVVCFVIFGTINTMATKWTDITSALGNDNTVHLFKHPFIQSCAMFLGQCLCFAAYFIFAKPDISMSEEGAPTGDGALNFWFPAMCDFVGSTLDNIGLLLTYASVYQMLRGSVVIFTSLFSYLFLGKRYTRSQILGLFLVVLGLGVVGLSSMVSGSSAIQAPSPMLGNVMITIGQIVQSVQMVVEEFLFSKYNVHPLLAVGYEGIFGFVFSAVALAVFFFLPGWSTNGRMEDAVDAFVQIANSKTLGYALLLLVTSVALFNYLGLTITKFMNSTTRVIADSVRIFVIWAVCLIVGWERFQWIQPIGFTVLLLGFFVFNGILSVPGQYFADASEKEGSVEEKAPFSVHEEPHSL